MRRLITPSWWATHWPMTLVYVVVCAVFVYTVNSNSNQRDADLRETRARAEDIRDANVRYCRGANERTALLRDFVTPFTADPDPRQYEFIVDPELRQGVLDQARRSRVELRKRVDSTFTQRDCERDFPPIAPPPEK